MNTPAWKVDCFRSSWQGIKKLQKTPNCLSLVQRQRPVRAEFNESSSRFPKLTRFGEYPTARRLRALISRGNDATALRLNGISVRSRVGEAANPGLKGATAL